MKITIELPDSIYRIIDDTAQRNGMTAARQLERDIVAHMIATDQAFECGQCCDYYPMAALSHYNADGREICCVCNGDVA